MTDLFQTRSPIDGTVLFERSYASDEDLDRSLARAHSARAAWKSTPLATRLTALKALSDHLAGRSDELAVELTRMMGRPLRYAPGELAGFSGRAEAMIAMAPQALADTPLPRDGFTRLLRREPLGVVLALSPWNYPYLTAVNAVVPALAAGNTVILKHAEQTALVAERIDEAAQAAGLPAGVFQVVHATHPQVGRMAADPRCDFVCFTGSVEGGRAVQQAAAAGFAGVGLELGGKDPAYVRADADLDHAIENLAEGAFFNSGQSCCGIERIYVHHSLYDRFVDGIVAQAEALVLGDPLENETTLGPMVRARNADHVRNQIGQALQAGARALVDPTRFPSHADQGTYLAPQVLVDVTHDMAVMTEETFGPVVGIQRVADDDEAIRQMNDSRYGLTAALWTQDEDAALALGNRLETGTVFMNRCDFLDPELAWVGVKDSGRGCTLSRVGYEQLTRPKSFHFRHLA